MSTVAGLPEGHEVGIEYLKAQRARKAAEDDAARLAVRVAQLTKEKEKAAKKINETRKRATEIHTYKRRNEETRMQKEALQKERYNEILQQSKILNEARVESNRRKKESSEALAKAKREMTIVTQAERAQNEKYLAEQRLLDRKTALEHKDEIKRQQIEQQKAAIAQKEKKLDLIKKEYLQRLDQERKAQQEKESEIAKLARMELELIQDLQSKQEEQRSAYMELEAALGDGTKKTQQVAAEVAGDEPGEAEVQKVFASIDTEGTGTIPLSKLDELMRGLGIELDPSQLQQATEQLDRDGSGNLAYGDFILWWRG